MTKKTLLARAAGRYLRPLFMLLALTLLLQATAYAGGGSFRKTGPTTGVFDFCVSLRFHASDTQITRIKSKGE